MESDCKTSAGKTESFIIPLTYVPKPNYNPTSQQYFSLVSSQPSESAVLGTCVDSDDGENLFEAGYARYTARAGGFIDSCDYENIGANKIKEAICLNVVGSQFRPTFVVKNCPATSKSECCLLISSIMSWKASSTASVVLVLSKASVFVIY